MSRIRNFRISGCWDFWISGLQDFRISGFRVYIFAPLPQSTLKRGLPITCQRGCRHHIKAKGGRGDAFRRGMPLSPNCVRRGGPIASQGRDAPSPLKEGNPITFLRKGDGLASSRRRARHLFRSWISPISVSGVSVWISDTTLDVVEDIRTL